MNELCTVAATELARRIRAREISSLAVVDAHISRIEAVNPVINAVVADRFEQARADARACDVELADGRRSRFGRFFGVPFTVKELIAVEGMPWTAGIVARRDIVATEHAPQVKRLIDAGGIVLGVTNISESGLWLESANKVYGRTNNPWNPKHIAGGSTGGEAAIIAAGGSPMGVGADIGGSIRNPCFFNGICGHKPSGGFLPAVGHFPSAAGLRGRYCVTGPMARTVDDLDAMLHVVSPEADPHRDIGRAAYASRTIDPTEMRVYTFDGTGLARVSEDMKAALRRTESELRSAGFTVERWTPPGLRRSADMWGAKLAVTGDPPIKEFLGNGEPINLLGQWARWPLRRANHSLISLIMASGEVLTHTGQRRMEQLIAQADRLRGTIEQKLGDDGVLVFPVYPRSAPRHHQPLLIPFGFTWCGIINVLELPSTAVPTGFSRNGLPLGVQVVGRRFADPTTIAVARYVETAFGGWSPAPVI
jgi:fatty acid amide hydrolase 2